MSGYAGSRWFDDAARAEAAWMVMSDTGELWRAGTRVVEAAAGTGSRYLVLVTTVGPEGAFMLGGDAVVSVLHPWQAVYPFAANGGELHWNYVREKLTRSAGMDVHAGDLVALTLTVGFALDRPVTLPVRPEQGNGLTS